MSTSNKAAVVSSVMQDYANSQATFFVNFSGLSVASLEILRKSLRPIGAKLKVTKVRLFKKALSDSNAPGTVDGPVKDIVGQVALVFSGQDCVEAAKVLTSFEKQQSIKDFLVGGVYKDVEYMDSSRVSQLSKLPGRDALLGSACFAISYPLVGLARSLNEITTSLARAIDAVAKK